MPKHKWTLAVVIVVATAASGTAIAIASSQAGKANGTRSRSDGTSFTLRQQGAPVAAHLISAQDRRTLSVTGATDQLYLLEQNGGHSYYRAVGLDGKTCYAVGDGSQIVRAACLHVDAQMPTALFDASSAVVYPNNPAAAHLVSVEGIAADQVSAVGIERSDGTRITTPVVGNTYHFPESSIPRDAEAIVALDSSGTVLAKKSLRNH
jgi:hypothetical protein